MNVDRLGRWDVAPRAHPNDGRADVVEVAADDGPAGPLAGVAAPADRHPRARTRRSHIGRVRRRRRGRSTGRVGCGSTASTSGTVRSLARRRRARRGHRSHLTAIRSVALDAWILDESPGAYRWGEIDLPELGADDVRIRVVASALNHMDLWVTGACRSRRCRTCPGATSPASSRPSATPCHGHRRRRRGRRQPRRLAGRGHRRPRQRQPDGPRLRDLRRAHVGRPRRRSPTAPVAQRRAPPGRPDAGRSARRTRWRRSPPTGCCAGPACRPARPCSSSASARACRAPPWPSPGTSAPRSSPPAAARPSATEALAMGAVAAIDSADERWPVQADVVVESVGAATWDKSVRALKAGGRLVVCGGTSGAEVELNLPRLFFKQFEIIGSSMGSYQEFAELTALDGPGSRRPRRPGPPARRLPGRARPPGGRRAARQDRAAPLRPGPASGRGAELHRPMPNAGHGRSPRRVTPSRRIARRDCLRPGGVQPRAKPTCCGATSPTSTGRCSPWSTCPRSSRARCSPATAAARRACAGCSSTSSSATSTSPATRRSTPPSGCSRAEELYEKVFVEYGDDSVAQLGGVHLACEQASNILTKVLEWGRLMSYLEQSTRYIAYDARLGGRYRFYRDPAVLASRLGTRYVGDMDRLFDAYSQVLAAVTDHVRATVDARSRRQRLRVPPGDPGQGARRRPRDPAGGVAVERRHLRQRAGVRGAAAAAARPPAARGPRLRRADAARAAQGDPELPAPRRPRRARRPVERRTSRRPAQRTAELVDSLFADETPAPAPRR